MNFIFEEEVKKLGVNGAYFTIEGMTNCKAHDAFESYKDAFLQTLDVDLISSKINDEGIIGGFRELHKKVNCIGKKYVSSPENLLSYFVAKQGMPCINLIVDIYNLVSIKTELALGAHDISNINGDVSLKLTKGNEHFLPLGYSKSVPVRAGEYCYIDESNDVLCRLEVRQVEKTKVTETTTDCFYIVQGNEKTTSNIINDAAQEVIDLTLKFCGGSVRKLYTP